jgi:DNA polymerase-3 subunit delta
MTESQRLLEDMKSNKYAPIYFLQGEEPYYIDLICEFVEQNALQESERGFNQVVVYGKEITMSDILTHARRFPMMSDRQVVIVKEAQNIIDFGKEEGAKLFEHYLDHPQPSTILVFCYKYKTLDKRKKLTKTIEKQAVVFNSRKLYDNQVPAWISQYLAYRNFPITDKAVEMLAENIGNDLVRLSKEIDKMLINVQPGAEIDDHAIQRFIGISREYNAFELQKAIVYKDILKANKIAAYFEANPKNNPVIPVIGVLYSLFSKLLVLHHSKVKNEKEIAGALKINPYFAREYKVGINNYNLPKILQNIHYIKNADLMSKGVYNASLSDGQILKELVFKLLH